MTSSAALIENQEFLRDVWDGLAQTPRSIPSKYFYDEEGSRLFDRICELDEYYLTRAEAEIMRAQSSEIAALIGPRSLLVEYGSGSSQKTRLLLSALESQGARPVAYVPLDISCAHLEAAAARLRLEHQRLDVRPLALDYTQPFDLPPLEAARRVAYFPGSTLGNFERAEAQEFLTRIRETVGEGGALILGLDLKKDPQVLGRAYNDRDGVTAAFNLNLLARANRELQANFDLAAWSHRADWNEDESRIEMRLVSEREQAVFVAGRAFCFGRGQTILTEYSHKYTRGGARDMADRAGFGVRQAWLDGEEAFTVLFLEAR
jgi:dimethylhistidine N-methyltransferase